MKNMDCIKSSRGTCNHSSKPAWECDPTTRVWTIIYKQTFISLLWTLLLEFYSPNRRPKPESSPKDLLLIAWATDCESVSRITCCQPCKRNQLRVLRTVVAFAIFALKNSENLQALQVIKEELESLTIQPIPTKLEDVLVDASTFFFSQLTDGGVHLDVAEALADDEKWDLFQSVSIRWAKMITFAT